MSQMTSVLDGTPVKHWNDFVISKLRYYDKVSIEAKLYYEIIFELHKKKLLAFAAFAFNKQLAFNLKFSETIERIKHSIRNLLRWRLIKTDTTSGKVNNNKKNSHFWCLITFRSFDHEVITTIAFDVKAFVLPTILQLLQCNHKYNRKNELHFNYFVNQYRKLNCKITYWILHIYIILENDSIIYGKSNYFQIRLIIFVDLADWPIEWF